MTSVILKQALQRITKWFIYSDRKAGEHTPIQLMSIISLVLFGTICTNKLINIQSKSVLDSEELATITTIAHE